MIRRGGCNKEVEQLQDQNNSSISSISNSSCRITRKTDPRLISKSRSGGKDHSSFNFAYVKNPHNLKASLIDSPVRKKGINCAVEENGKPKRLPTPIRSRLKQNGINDQEYLKNSMEIAKMEERLDMQISARKHDESTYIESIQSRQKLLDQKELQISEFKNEIATLRTKNQQLSKCIVSSEQNNRNNLERMRKQIKDNRLNEINRKNQKLDATVRQLQTEKDRLKQDVKALNIAIEKLKNSNQQLLETNQKLANEKVYFEKAFNQNFKQLVKVGKQKYLESQVSNLKGKLSESKTQVEERLAESLREQKIQLEESKKARNKLEIKVMALERAKAKELGELADRKNQELKVIRKRLSEKIAQIHQIKQQLQKGPTVRQTLFPKNKTFNLDQGRRSLIDIHPPSKLQEVQLELTPE